MRALPAEVLDELEQGVGFEHVRLRLTPIAARGGQLLGRETPPDACSSPVQAEPSGNGVQGCR